MASLGPRAYRSSRGAPGGGTGGRIGCEGGCGGSGAPPDGVTAPETPPGGGGPGGWDAEAILGIRKPPPPPPDDVAPAGAPAVAPSGGPSTIFPGGMTSSPVSRRRLQRAPGTGLVKCHSRENQQNFSLFDPCRIDLTHLADRFHRHSHKVPFEICRVKGQRRPSTYFLRVLIDQHPFHGSNEYPRERNLLTAFQSGGSRGLMDKASVFGTEDCRFDPCRDQRFFFFTFETRIRRAMM